MNECVLTHIIIIQDCSSLYQQARAISGNLEKWKSQLEQLEHKLGINHSRDACPESGLVELVRHTLQKLEGEMELIQLSIKRREDAIKHNSSKSVVQKNTNSLYISC